MVICKINILSDQTIIANGVELQQFFSLGYTLYAGSADINSGSGQATTSPTLLVGSAATTSTVYKNGTLVASGNAGTGGSIAALRVGDH